MRLGRYEILGLLGRGGMGAVYKAHDPLLDRFVAVKQVNTAVGTGVRLEEAVERLRREAQAAGRLSHPNIVAVHDLEIDEPTGAPFIVMEYVDGVTLSTVLGENATVPLVQALEILEGVGAAVAAAHERGIVHRDIKPSNVFLDTRGRVKVGDFGIARLPGSDLTEAGVALGTPGYLAPELISGGAADFRSDVFALGVLAYHLFAGKPPFAGPTLGALTMDVAQRDPDPPSRLRPTLPPHLSTAVMRALEKSPANRTPTIQAFLRDLHGERTTPVTPPTVRLQATSPRIPRGWLAAAALGLGLAVLIAARGCPASPGRDAAPPAATVEPLLDDVPVTRSPTPGRTLPPVTPRTPEPIDEGRQDDEADGERETDDRPQVGKDKKKRDRGRHGGGRGKGKGRRK